MSIIISTLKNSEIKFIKKKLILLYLLNVLDIIFTICLTNTGVFEEVNFIIAKALNNNKLLSLLLKIIIPLILLVWVFGRMKKATKRQLAKSNIIIIAALVLYGIINMFHVFWCIWYFSL